MRVAIYVRVSTIEQYQEGYSIPAQITTLKQYCASYQLIVHKVYSDSGISGKNIKDRPALMELIGDAQEQKFDVVLVWKLSRLSRRLIDLLSVVDIFTDNNISFQSYSEKFDTSTPTGKMMLQLLGSIAEFERNTIAENVRFGLNERFSQGYSKGSIPFGYTYVEKEAVIVPAQSDIVKYIFETYNNSEDGNCLTDLAQHLNINGHRTRTGGLWTRVCIRDMLKNHFYAGYVRTKIHSHGYQYSDSEIKPGKHEPIISQELFDSVNLKLDKKKMIGVIRNPDNDSILTGLVICPLCGCKMFGLNTYNKYTNKKGETTKYEIRQYRCTENNKGGMGCKGFYLSANKIEPGVIETLKRMKVKKLLSELKKIKDSSAVKVNKTDVIDTQLKELYSVRDKYFKLFETGKVNTELFADKINEILKNIDQLEQEKKTIPTEINFDDKDIIKIIENDLEKFLKFNDLSNKTKKELIRIFVKAVIINTDKELKSIITTFGLEIHYH